MLVLDKIDRLVLLELDRNARQSFSQIAEKTGTSKGVVAYRVEQLVKKGVIDGFYTVVDTVKLGYKNHRIYVRLQNCSQQKKDEMIRAFIDEPGTWWVARTSYPWDFAVILLAKTTHAAHEKVIGVIEEFPGSIAECSISTYVRLVHFTKEYLSGENEIGRRQAFELGDERGVELTGLERRLLLQLSSDARASTVELAKRLGTTPMVVKYAIKKLVKAGVILGFRVLLDYAKIGYAYYWISIEASARRVELQRYVQALPNTVYFDEMLGGSAVEFAVHIKREDDVQELVERLMAQFGEAVRDYNYFRVIKNEKVIYVPQDMVMPQ